MPALRPIAALILTGLFALGAFSTASANHNFDLSATLTGPSIDGQTPSGRAEWHREPVFTSLVAKMRVEVRDVNLPNGTVLTVRACKDLLDGQTTGTIVLSGKSGKLDLDTKKGQRVPLCTRGDHVRIFHGATLVLAGELRGKLDDQ